MFSRSTGTGEQRTGLSSSARCLRHYRHRSGRSESLMGFDHEYRRQRLPTHLTPRGALRRRLHSARRQSLRRSRKRQRFGPQSAHHRFALDCDRFLSNAEQTLSEEGALVLCSGKHEEIAAADRLDVLLQRFAAETLLNRQKPGAQIGLEAHEQQAHIELPGGGNTTRVVIAQAQDETGFACFIPWIGKPDMRIACDALVLRIARVSWNIVLIVHAERGAAHLVPADDPLLLCEWRAVPAFDQVANDAY